MTKYPSNGTYDDVNLILRLYEIRREDRMRKARAWFVANFHVKTMDDLQKVAPVGSDENASMRMVVSYWEMVASFVTSGVLNEEIFFHSGRESLLVYGRLKPVLAQMREANKDPFSFKNLETVGESFIEFLNRRAPGSYDAFAERMNKR
jgi:hypothetical protein